MSTHLAAFTAECSEEDGRGARLREFAALDNIFRREDVTEQRDDKPRVIALLLLRYLDAVQAQLDGEIVGSSQELVTVEKGDDFTGFGLRGQASQSASLYGIVSSSCRPP